MPAIELQHQSPDVGARSDFEQWLQLNALSSKGFRTPVSELQDFRAPGHKVTSVRLQAPHELFVLFFIFIFFIFLLNKFQIF